ncbi:hypothetical protein PUNSTDRAFT_41242 [Punctularia strigosozonata HHB-11173 SS5]|uniref:uncharacterized protein n=1 Tax=Punctularia strigosozonata (strain HHB-11173) TaxID=741275 RepID=UPI0004417C61|nr:uncharacterized protein PUNSTDRAFT_41242 [Punctularia strigosozonata HHB-11173 SS5]EIN13795.1 hypothetical protein PUNSTDRAFT_41242 [Punctularia strigosozonata HHB-11173 SS5]
MPVVASVVLRLLHCLYTVVTLLASVRYRFSRQPHSLLAHRRKTPQHLAVVLASNTEENLQATVTALLNTVENAATWCRAARIPRLTVYDREGLLVERVSDIRGRIVSASCDEQMDQSNHEIAYPLTPPLSDSSDSRPLSPDHFELGLHLRVMTITSGGIPARKLQVPKFGVKRRYSAGGMLPQANLRYIVNLVLVSKTSQGAHPLTVHIVSAHGSKPAIVQIARTFGERMSQASTGVERYSSDSLSVETIQNILEGPHGLPPPDLLIVHNVYGNRAPRTPLELHEFPPWQIRLTEFHHEMFRTPNWLSPWRAPCPTSLTELEFRTALDEPNDKTDGAFWLTFSQAAPRKAFILTSGRSPATTLKSSSTPLSRRTHPADRDDVRRPKCPSASSNRSNSKGQYFKRVIVCCDGTTKGAVGAHLASKVQEAYSFIAHNYRPGDEIFLFGFSRGAYTARMVAAMIGEIGVLDRTDMDHFASVFMAFQKRGKEKDPEGNIAEIAKLDKELHPWVQHNSPGKLRADSDEHSFSIKCVGVFDTVGSYHAMALNETREDFNVCKFEQTPGGHSKGQKLDQIGGGWQEHDLSDLTLWWMVSKIQDIIAVDARYLTSLVDPVAPWGQLPPHDPRTGIMKLTDTVTRTLPTSTNDVTHEKIHLSVLHQSHLMPALKQNIDANPALVAELTQLEAELKHYWPFVPGTHLPYMPQGVKKHGDDRVEMALASVFEKGVSIGTSISN